MNIVISLYTPVVDTITGRFGIPCFYETFIKALQREGNSIFVHVSRQWRADYLTMPPDLKARLDAFKPDLFILFNNTFYDVTPYYDCPVVVYEVDSPLYYSNKQALINNVSRYKFVVCQDEAIAMLKEQFGVQESQVIQIPFFSEIQAEDKEIDSNIVFIGTHFTVPGTPSIFNKFHQNNFSDEDRRLMLVLMRKFMENQCPSTEQLVSSCENIPKHLLPYVRSEEWLMMFSAYNRVRTISAVAELGLTIYGTSSWVKDTYREPWIIMSYNPKQVYSLKHNQDLYNSAKIGININHLQARSGFSWRVCDIMASNACLVSEYKPNISKYFGDVKIPTFSNPHEAYHICKQLLADEERRRDIVLASQQVIREKYRFRGVLDSFEQFIGMKLRGEATAPTYEEYEKVVPPASTQNNAQNNNPNKSVDQLTSQVSQLKSELSRSEKGKQEAVLLLRKTQRVLQLQGMLPSLKRKYMILRLKKAFSLGKRRRRYQEKKRAVKALIQEYRDIVSTLSSPPQ